MPQHITVDRAAADAPAYRVQTRHLSVFYRGAAALDDICVGFEASSITAIVGPSGCGKSTLLRCLNRMNDVVEGARVKGKVLLDGRDICAPGVDVLDLRRRVGMVFQRPICFPGSVWDNVTYGPRALGGRRRPLAAVARECLEAVGLWATVRDRPHQPAQDLPLGQQQLLCLARALAVEPEVLLLDEPCSALDPASTLEIEELLKGLRRLYTIVLVTHNMQQAARASDSTVFLLGGRLIEHGPTRQMFTAPEDSRTEAYVRGDVVGLEAEKTPAGVPGTRGDDRDVHQEGL